MRNYVQTSSKAERRIVFLLTGAVSFIVLAGQFGFERAGAQNPFPVPERFLISVIALVILAPASWLVLKHRTENAPRHGTKGVKALWCFLGYLCLSTLWAPSWETSQVPFYDLVTIVVLCVLIQIAARIDNKRTLSLLFSYSLLFGIIFSLAGLLLGVGTGSRLAAFGGGPNVYARITGMGIVAALYFLAKSDRPNLYLVLMAPMIVSTILSGSRGAMVGLVASLIIAAPLAKKILRPRQIISLAALIVPMYILVLRYGPVIQEVVGRRIVRLTFEEGYTAGRTPLYESAWDLFMSKPVFGSGLHAWEFLIGRFQGFAYPHNLTIQTAAEGGIVGVILLVIVVWMALARGLRTGSDATIRRAALAAFVLIISAQQFSGDYYDSRQAWIFLVALLGFVPSENEADLSGDHRLALQKNNGEQHSVQ